MQIIRDYGRISAARAGRPLPKTAASTKPPAKPDPGPKGGTP
jgi:hypothetical protein